MKTLLLGVWEGDVRSRLSLEDIRAYWVLLFGTHRGYPTIIARSRT